MKRSFVLTAAAVCLAAGSAWAQGVAPTGQAASYGAYSYYDAAAYQPSPSDQVPAPPVAQTSALNYGVGSGCDIAAAPSCGAPEAYNGCDACDSCGHGCFHDWLGCWPCGCLLSDLGEAHKLWEPCDECSPWTAGGWIAQSYTWNPYDPVDRFNGPVTWTDRSNEYQMNELYGYIGRAANTEGCGWDWGARVDALYGTNYRWCTSTGIENHFGNGSFYGLALPQMYGEVAYNDWSVKVGRMYSPVGYYVVGTANNFFPVLPYTFQYGEPFTHTGVHAFYKYSDSLTLSGAVIHGWDNSDNTGNPHGGGLVTATYAIDEARSFAYVGVFGPEPNFSGVNPSTGPAPATGTGFTSRYLQTLVYTDKISDDVTWVLQSDYGEQNHALVAGDMARWYGINTYLYWNQTCRTQWGLNGEWFRDEGGFRVGGVLPSFASPNARGLPLTRSGYDGSFYRITFGPRYYFTPNIYTRAAFLADWYVGKANNPGGLRPFDDGTKDYQQIMVFDVVATF